MECYHEPVLLQQVVDFLQIRSGGIYVDGTAGTGGHTEAIAERVCPGGKVIAIDLDREAIAMAGKRLERFGECVEFVTGNFAEVDRTLAERNIEKVQGMVMDLGFSSYQLARAERGFAFSVEGPLDMRMSRESGPTANEVINEYPEEDIAGIIREFGEERFSRRIAAAIVMCRKEKKIESTTQLAQIVTGAIPRKYQSCKLQPATKTFQALRIFINSELDNLKKALPKAIDCLGKAGRLIVISFHSLEDRIVKTTFRKFAAGCTCPPSFPVCRCDNIPLVKIITRRPVVPTKEEVQRNPRSRSAKMRVCEKL